jgi:hypothetical protein
VTGLTDLTKFPTTPGAFQAKKSGTAGENDAFVTKIDPPGDAASVSASNLSAGATRRMDSFILLPAAPPEGPLFQRGNVRATGPNEARLGTDILLAFLPAQPAGLPFRSGAFSLPSLNGIAGEFERLPQPVPARGDAGSTSVPHGGRPAQALSAASDLVDDLFARGIWFPEARADDPALGLVR